LLLGLRQTFLRKLFELALHSGVADVGGAHACLKKEQLQVSVWLRIRTDVVQELDRLKVVALLLEQEESQLCKHSNKCLCSDLVDK
jgi:nitric oxide reductase large subunit